MAPGEATYGGEDIAVDVINNPIIPGTNKKLGAEGAPRVLRGSGRRKKRWL